MKTLITLAALSLASSLAFAQNAGGDKVGGPTGGGSGGSKGKSEEKASTKAVTTSVVVRWFSPDVKSADVEAALKGKDYIKSVQLRAEEQIVTVVYNGDFVGIDRVRQLVAGGSSVILSPCKMKFSFSPCKDAKDPKIAKVTEAVRRMKGIEKEESFVGSTAVLWADAQVVNVRTVGSVAGPLGYDTTCDSHDIMTISWEYTERDQPATPLFKSIMSQKGVMLSLEFNSVDKRLVIQVERGALTEATIKTLVQKAGFKPGDVKKQ